MSGLHSGTTGATISAGPPTAIVLLAFLFVVYPHMHIARVHPAEYKWLELSEAIQYCNDKAQYLQ